MNFKKIATAALLAGVAITASATATPSHTVEAVGQLTNGDDYNPIGSWNLAPGTKKNANNSISDNDFYDFSLSEQEAVTAVLSSVTSNISGATLALYSGDFEAGDSLSSFSLVKSVLLGTKSSATIFDNLVAGDYFFVVQGTLNRGTAATNATVYGSYDLNVGVVPEPGNAALLLAGVGLFGLVAKRRKIVG